MWLCTTMSVGRSRVSSKVLQATRGFVDVVGISHLQHLPAAGREARADVLGEGDGRRAFDADVVAVVDPAQPAELQMAGERRRLGADAFHHVAVAGQREHAVIEQREAGAVVGGGQPGLGDGHAHAGGHALAQRPGGGLDAGGPAMFRMPGAAAAGLAKALQVGHRDGQTVARGSPDSSRPSRRTDAAARTTAPRRGRPTARSGRGRARRRLRGRSAGSAATGSRPWAPRPSACPGARSWPSAPGRWPACAGC